MGHKLKTSLAFGFCKSFKVDSCRFEILEEGGSVGDLSKIHS